MSTTAFTVTGVPQRLNVGLAVLRIVTGLVVFMHGWQKVFQYGFAAVTRSFTQMGIPMPGLTGPLVGIVELLAGIALMIGLLTRLAALGSAIIVLGALLIVHFRAGFFMPQGYEFTLTLFAASVALALMGGGEYSIDAAVARHRNASAPTY